jgi:hypothetical protein
MSTPTSTTPQTHPTSPGPSSGSCVLRQLRGDLGRRPLVDATLAGGLRAWLEDGVAETVGPTHDRSRPFIVDKRTLNDPWGGPELRGGRSIPLARGALIDVLFRQLVTTGRVDAPMEDGIAGLRVDGRQGDLLAFIEHLSEADRALLSEEVTHQARVLADRWPTLANGWLPRTQERITIPLAGGAVVLSGVIDLVVGTPSSGRASTGLIEVKSGRRSPEHRADVHYYALLETLRSGAPPFRVATYYTATGEIDAEEVTEELLIASVQRTIDCLAGIANALAPATGAA